MTTKIKIPKGWFRIKRWAIIQNGDKYLSDDSWTPTTKSGHGFQVRDGQIYIRKDTKTKQ